MSKLYTPSQAGRYLGGDKPVSHYTLARWRKQGTGPDYIKIGRTFRYPEDGLDRYLDQNKNA